MNVKFFSQDVDSPSFIKLREILDSDFEIPIGTDALGREAIVNERFKTLVSQQPDLPQLFAVWTKSKESGNGTIIAAEAVIDGPRQRRQLVWLFKSLDYEIAIAANRQAKDS